MADPLEQERAVVSGLLLDPSQDNAALREIRGVLSAADFSDSRHAAVYSAMCDAVDAGQFADAAAVERILQSRGVLAAHGGAEFLKGLCSGTRMRSVAAPARAVHGRALLRELAYMGRDAEAQANDDDADPAVLVDALQRKLLALSNKANPGGFRDNDQIMREAMRELTLLAESPDGIIGLRTGLTEVDEIVGGLRGGWLVLVGARTGEGKTVLGTVVAEWVARADNAVAFFSVEMSAAQLMLRRILTQAKVSIQTLRSALRGPRAEQTLAKVSSAAEEIRKRKVFVDDDSHQTVPKIRAACRRLQAQHGLSLVVVDYLQLLKPTQKQERRDLDIGEMSAGLKALAKDFNVPVLALCQLGRKADGQRPTLVHFRESGNLEQDADVALLIHHPEPTGLIPEPLSEIIIAKNRHGATGLARVRFNRHLATLENAAQAEDFVA
jgi:replicative DNA helicase